MFNIHDVEGVLNHIRLNHFWAAPDDVLNVQFSIGENGDLVMDVFNADNRHVGLFFFEETLAELNAMRAGEIDYFDLFANNLEEG